MGKKYTNFTINLGALPESEQWYAITTKYNHEQYIIDKIRDSSLNTLISDAFTPTEDVTTITTKGDKEVIKVKKQKIMPNTVFIKTKLDITVWKLLMNTTGITSVMCMAGIPSIISNNEILRMKSLTSNLA